MSLLRFAFVRHCDVFFITSQLHYLFIPCSYVFYDVRIMLHFGTFKLRTEIMLQNGDFFSYVCLYNKK